MVVNMLNLKDIKVLDTIIKDGNRYEICRALYYGEPKHFLRTEHTGWINYSYSKQFDEDYYDGITKELEEYNWSIAEQIVK
jgi:hypothetical protein